MNREEKGQEGSLKTYLAGFFLSVVLTLGSYFAVTKQLLATQALIFTIFAFGLIQVLVQLIFFLHLGKEPKPRWNLTVFLYMVLVLVIIVSGSIWIMRSLAYNLS